MQFSAKNLLLLTKSPATVGHKTWW